MKDYLNSSKEKDILADIIELTNNWIFVFTKNQELVQLYIQQDEVKEALKNDLSNGLSIEERGRFDHFFEKIKHSSEKEVGAFIFEIKGETYPLEITGATRGENIILIGDQKHTYNDLTSFAEEFPFATFTISRDGVISYWNEEMRTIAYKFGYNLEKDKQYLLHDFTGPFFFQINEHYEKWINDGAKSIEIVTVRGKDFSLLVNAFEFDGFLFIVIKDQSFQERIKQLLTAQQQMEVVSQVAAGVAHELRNPLSVIKGFLQLSKLSNNIEKYYDTIFTEIDRMNKIIEDFLSVSRKKIDMHYYQSKELMESLLMIFRSECLLHDIELSYSINEEDATLYINEQMIKQVLLNILRNSVEAYEGQKGNRTFKVRTRIKDDHFEIELTDQGPGIPPEVMARIDEPFYTTKEKGTGIGIPLCHHIIEEHEGKLKIDSSVGKGTTVTVFLPLQ
ncbi:MULTISPECIES: two-component system sensor histidine kinase NtrB [Bacillaceae]|uniref:histidine kinase n=1 Tax=Evansella alkalicola TaxID=745819 RepID=A0ABS6JZF6_9BACI|nr:MULTISPECIES: ATP-binding protein [Bacillaceae]MBU9722475.1 GHKL domain-containing protein [Bacillus alkalicola]